MALWLCAFMDIFEKKKGSPLAKEINWLNLHVKKKSKQIKFKMDFILTFAERTCTEAKLCLF